MSGKQYIFSDIMCLTSRSQRLVFSGRASPVEKALFGHTYLETQENNLALVERRGDGWGSVVSDSKEGGSEAFGFSAEKFNDLIDVSGEFDLNWACWGSS